MATTLVQTKTLEPVHVHVHEHEPGLEFSIPLAPIASIPRDAPQPETAPAHISKLRKVAVVLQLCGVTFASSVSNGLVIVALPAITKDVQLPPSLAFWPASVSGLATASTLLLAGSVADALGPRDLDLAGCLVGGALMIGCGLVRQGTGLVAMRALQGVGLGIHLSCAVSIVTQALPQGKSRNIAFACLGLSQPLGFSFGLVIGGILVDTVGWRAGWFLAGSCTLFFTAIGVWAVPRAAKRRNVHDVIRHMKEKVDWGGALLASAAMTLLCYLLAILSADSSRIREPMSICFLCLSVVCASAFVYWMHFRVKHDMLALIPNRLWGNKVFSSVCATITLSFAVVNSMELFCSLFFQQVQHLAAIQASIRIVPSTMLGVVINIIVGLYVHKIPAFWIVTVTAILSTLAPLLMAVADPSGTYWANAFFSQLFQPASCNALFTVGMLVITDIFPTETQALAGAVFNTCAQFGTALGFSILQIISAKVTQVKLDGGNDADRALLEGYRASFWAMFVMMIFCTLVGMFGLRKIGNIGLKKD